MSLAVQFSEYGTPDVLRIVDVPPLTAGPGQVRLAVRAAGVNPIDWKILRVLAVGTATSPTATSRL